MKCDFCDTEPGLVMLNGQFACIQIPARQHIGPKDGGHLMVVPFRHVQSRSDLLPHEIAEMTMLSIIAAESLKDIFNSGWTNYQENGNWALDDPQSQHLHVHVYGRAREGVTQRFGEALRFPFRTELKEWRVDQISPAQVEALRTSMNTAYQLPKWNRHKKAIAVLLGPTESA